MLHNNPVNQEPQCESKEEAIPPSEAAPPPDPLMKYVRASGMLPQENDEEFERSLQCPITTQIFLNPVQTNCGHVFEEEAIQQICCGEKKNCPSCRAVLIPSSIRTNYKVVEFVELFLKRFPDKKDGQYKPNQQEQKNIVPIVQRPNNIVQQDGGAPQDEDDLGQFRLIFCTIILSLAADMVLTDLYPNDDYFAICFLIGVCLQAMMNLMIVTIYMDRNFCKEFTILTSSIAGGVGTWLLTDSRIMPICENAFAFGSSSSIYPFMTRGLLSVIGMDLVGYLSDNIWKYQNLQVPLYAVEFYLAGIITFMSFLLNYEYAIYLSIMNGGSCDQQNYDIDMALRTELISIMSSLSSIFVLHEIATLMANADYLDEIASIAISGLCGYLTWLATDGFISNHIDSPLGPIVHNNLTAAGMATGCFVNQQARELWRNRNRLFLPRANDDAAVPPEARRLLLANEEQQRVYGAV